MVLIIYGTLFIYSTVQHVVIYSTVHYVVIYSMVVRLYVVPIY